MGTLPTPAEFLRMSGEYMDKHGKCIGIYESWDGRVCMWGAMEAVSKQLIATQDYFAGDVYDVEIVAKTLLSLALKPLVPDARVFPVFRFSDKNDEKTAVKKFYEVADQLEFES